MAAPKGTMPPSAGRGRRKGEVNKIPRLLKDYIIQAAESLEKAGEGLSKWAKDNPGEFWTKVYVKVVPRPVELTGKDGEPFGSKVNNDEYAKAARERLLEEVAQRRAEREKQRRIR